MAGRKISLDHIPPEDHQGIGLVANAWNHLEGALERIIWRLARLDDNTGASITAHMGLRARLDAACALAELHFPDAPETSRLNKLHGYILGEEMYGTRNELLHSRTLHFPDLSGYGRGKTVRPTYKARKVLKKEIKPVVSGEYKIAADRMLETGYELLEILSTFKTMIARKDAAPPP